jgi:hypothetical protein
MRKKIWRLEIDDLDKLCAKKEIITKCHTNSEMYIRIPHKK